MKPSPALSQPLAMLSVIMTLCWFVVVVADRWVTHAVPDSGFVLLCSLGGMTVVGAVVGFLVSIAANVSYRVGPPSGRLPFTAFIWIVFCAALTAWLLHTGVDRGRLVLLSAIATFCGLLVGPYHAELFVSYWRYKRRSAEVQSPSGSAP
jgi:Ca2+/H+ antiporter